MWVTKIKLETGVKIRSLAPGTMSLMPSGKGGKLIPRVAISSTIFSKLNWQARAPILVQLGIGEHAKKMRLSLTNNEKEALCIVHKLKNGVMFSLGYMEEFSDIAHTKAPVNVRIINENTIEIDLPEWIIGDSHKSITKPPVEEPAFTGKTIEPNFDISPEKVPPKIIKESIFKEPKIKTKHININRFPKKK